MTNFQDIWRFLYEFQPTPSARRVTLDNNVMLVVKFISTHTLRKEGDFLIYGGE